MQLQDYLEINNLRKIRLEKNLRQWQVSLMSKVTISRICQIEQGSPAKGQERQMLARALDTTTGTIWPEELNK